MPIFTFEGFTESSLVALSAAQGTQGAQGSVPEWRLSNMNTATLDIARVEPAELVAPVGIWFEATDLQGFAVSEPVSGIYDPTVHDITYIWDFGDPGTFTAPLNIPTAWNNKNVDYGKKAYHVFDTPGTYAVRLWAVDREGVTGERMVSVNVLDPDEVYSGVRTICVSNGSNNGGTPDHTGKPTGAREVTTLLEALFAMQALGQTGRILLRRGETFEEDFNLSGTLNFRVGAFGSAEDAKPVLRPSTPAGGSTGWGTVFNFRNANTISDAAFYDLDFQGDWDATKETGDPRASAIGTGAHNTIDWNILVYRCDFDGINGLMIGNGSVENWVYGVVDCHMVNVRDYMIGQFSTGFKPGEKMALVGSSFHDPENVCRGGYGQEGLGNVYGAVRNGATRNVIISACDFYNGTAPTGTNDVQPTLRLQSNGPDVPADWEFFLNVNRIVVEGGDIVIGISPMNAESPDLPSNTVLDMCLFIGDYNMAHALRASHGSITIRNAIMMSLANGTTRTALSFVNFVNELPRTGVPAMPVGMHNCTFYNVQSSAIPVTSNSSARTDLTVQNNVNHQPNASVTADGPINLTQTITGVRPRNRGRRVGPQKVSTSASGVGNGGTFTVSYPAGTGQTDFSASGRHTVKIGSSWWFSYRGDCSLSFGASNITVTNLSATTMNGTAQLGLDQDTLTTDTSLGSPEAVPLPVPIGDSPALVDGGAPQPYTQFDTGQRVRPKGAV